MNLSQLIVKLQVTGVKELEKIVKDLGKLNVFGGTKPGIPGQTGKGGPAEQSKLIKALGADYERYAKIVGNTGKEQVKSAEALTKQLKDQIATIEKMEEAMNSLPLDKWAEMKDKVDEAKKSVAALGAEIASLPSNTPQSFRSKFNQGASSFGAMISGPLAIASGAISAYGVASGVKADFATRTEDFAAREGSTWGAAYNRARHGSLADAALQRNVLSGRRVNISDYNSFMEGRLGQENSSRMLRMLPKGFIGDATDIHDFITRNDPTSEVAQRIKELRHEYMEKQRQGQDQNIYRAIEAYQGMASYDYERRVAGYGGSNAVTARAVNLGAKYNVSDDQVKSLHSAIIGAQGRGGRGLEAGVAAMGQGMDSGAIAAMLSAGPRGLGILQAVQGRGMDVVAQERVGQAAAGMVGNPMFSMGNPAAMVDMLGMGVSGDSASQIRIAQQNQAGVGSYSQIMTGSDAWGQTTSFINANIAASGLSLAAKRALAEIGKDPNKLAQIKAGTYQPSDGERGLGITKEMVDNYFSMQGQTEMSRFLNDPGLAGTQAGKHLAGAKAAGGWNKYFASMSPADQKKAMAESSTLMSMSYGGMEGILSTDEAAEANLRVRGVGGAGGGGGGGAGAARDPSAAASASLGNMKAKVDDVNSALGSMPGIIDAIFKAADAYIQVPNTGKNPWTSEYQKNPAPRVAPNPYTGPMARPPGT